MKKVLIVAPEDDLHASVIAQRISELGAQAHIWNSTWFPWSQSLTWTAEEGLSGLLCSGHMIADLSQYDRVWWRRFRRPTPSPRIEDHQVKAFCQGEAEMLLRSAFALLRGRIVNDPEIEHSVSRKPVQLSLAMCRGLHIPKTIVSNDINDIKSFIRQNKRNIVKPVSNAYPHALETKEIFEGDLDSADDVRLAPHIYQELIEARFDIRVCVIGDEIFAGQLERAEINETVDWRMKVSGWRPHQLSQSTEQALLQLTSSMGLHTASHDLRLDQNGNYVYLETNPSGQFLFLEVDAGLPLSPVFARYLLNGRHPGTLAECFSTHACY